MDTPLEEVTHADNIKLSDDGRSVVIIDQTLLPNRLEYIALTTREEMFEAIAMLRVRGAPAIGICAGYCAYCLALQAPHDSFDDFYDHWVEDCRYLNGSRPTAVNLSWALNRMLDAAEDHRDMPVEAVLSALKRECLAIHSEDMEMCRKISEYGLSLLHDGDGVLTHCNAGPLATSRYGTGQGPLFLAKERGMDIRVFADETRPLLQGARLTSFELHKRRRGRHPYMRQHGVNSHEKRLGAVLHGGLRQGSRQRRHSKQNRHQRRSHTCKALRHTLLRAGPYLHHRYELHHRGGHKYRAPGRGRDPEQILRGARGAARCQVLQPRLRCDGQFAYLRHYHGKGHMPPALLRELKEAF